MERISLKELAEEAGVSRMTVSRALRNAPGILPETQKRILEIARSRGYQEDPNLQKMMSYLRKVRSHSKAETIAWVWPDTTKEAAAQSPTLNQMLQGAEDRAKELGFKLDQFSLHEDNLSLKRLNSILQSRGIQCLIFAPLVHSIHERFEFPWDNYSTVVLGLGMWKQALHRVHFDHYTSMVLMLSKLKEMKRERIAFIVDNEVDERMYHSWSAAFIRNHPLDIPHAHEMLIQAKEPKPFFAQLKKLQVDTVILGYESAIELAQHPESPDHILYTTMNHCAINTPNPEGKILGINQNDGLWGANAIDMVSAQFQRGDRGIPEFPKTMLCQGYWQDSQSKKCT